MRKVLIIILFILLIGLVVVVLVFSKNDKSLTNGSHDTFDESFSEISAILPTETFIVKHLWTNKGHIKTTFTDDHFLAESIGLWLKYMLFKSDETQFEKIVDVIERDYLLEENIIAWEIKNEKKAYTNALIDDLRIVETLLLSDRFHDHERYLSLADAITDALLTYNKSNDYFVDFYDVFYKQAYDEITLSYLNTKAFQLMVENELMSNDLYKQLLAFLESIPQDEIFFPKSFNIVDGEFSYDEEIHLIDQLYVALYLEQANISTDTFFNWFKKAYTKEKVIYGRYDRQNKTKTVHYESAAVYALAIIYSLERADEVLAKDLYERMIEFRVADEDHSFFGGYVNLKTKETHSFDNLLPLVAERILQLEKVIDE